MTKEKVIEKINEEAEDLYYKEKYQYNTKSNLINKEPNLIEKYQYFIKCLKNKISIDKYRIKGIEFLYDEYNQAGYQL